MKRTQYFRNSLLVSLLLLATSCVEELKLENYYTFTGETITDYVENREEFSSFAHVLQRTGVNSLLSAYGTYTCFVPTNGAFDIYLRERGKSDVSELTDEECDTIAYGHIIKLDYMTTDMDNGVVNTPNMNDRYIQITIDTLTAEYFVNRYSKVIARDQECENGVVHVVDHVLSHSIASLFDLMKENPAISLFCEAVELTHMQDSLQGYIDLTFEPRPDDMGDGTDRNAFKKYYPTSRLIGYTGFIETNEVLYKAMDKAGLLDTVGRTAIDCLIDYAKKVYDEVFPDDAGITDYTDRRNSLNRFVSYHFLNRRIYTDKMTTELHFPNFAHDAFDFYETMCPGTIMKASRGKATKDSTRLNRRYGMSHGQPHTVKGVKVNHSEMFDGSNGVYYLIDAPLVYDKTVVTEVLNDRMRFDAATLMPELATNNIFRNGDGKGTVKEGLNKAYQITNGLYSYVDNLKLHQTGVVYYQTQSIGFWCWYADEVIAEGSYDFAIKLPPVPEGTYEIRYGYVPMSHRGVTQVYVGEEVSANKVSYVPCGIPIDLTEDGKSAKIGWFSDSGLTEEDITKNEKAMHNRGYMKGPDTQTEGADKSNVARNQSNHLRRIVTTQYLENNKEYWIRFRAVDEAGKEFMFDYLELCPKSVYDNPNNKEDRH